jgi:cephalosporin-C deacetylase-like acetyl esterase
MHRPSRREFLALGLAAPAVLAGEPSARPTRANVHQQILDLADRQQRERRGRFAAVRTLEDLAGLQQDLRRRFLGLLDGLPAASGPPPVRVTGRIDADDYRIDKLAYESFPGYFVSALLYRPKGTRGLAPAVLSPCGHSDIGKGAAEYQILHINLVKRGYVVLTYDPVGQGERSQFWDAARRRSRFNLSCGEHAVLGNPLYLLGTCLARYRIWDGIRALDYLASLPEVDGKRLGCAGNSGGGTLTAYIAALDPRVRVAVISCYITTLPRRMANRIQTDPDADPEQDIFGFVSAGIDHAGLLALRAPRPTLLDTARDDFFPIEGARESFAEAKRLYEVAGAGDRIHRAEAAAKHGLTLPLREAAYEWFDRWLAGRHDIPRRRELPVSPRPVKELLACPEGQVAVSFHSRPLLPLALSQFRKEKKRPRRPLKDVLLLDPDQADYRLAEAAWPGRKSKTLVLCVNGVEAPDWREEKALVRALARNGCGVLCLDPRGVGPLRPPLAVRGRPYADPLAGVEENIAYSAFLVGRSLLGMRVSDVLAAVARLGKESRPDRIVLCGRRDAALVACLAAAVEPRIERVAVEEMLTSFLPLFDAVGQPINAASILPGLLRDFGDVDDILRAIGPRKLLMAAPTGEHRPRLPSVRVAEGRFTQAPRLLTDFVG